MSLLTPAAASFAVIEIPPPLSKWLDCYTLMILVILYVTGCYFVRGDAFSTRWGLRIGAVCFVGSSVYGLVRTVDFDSRSILQTVGGAAFLAIATILVAWHAIPFPSVLLGPLARWLRGIWHRIYWHLTIRQRREAALQQALADLQADRAAALRARLDEKNATAAREKTEREARRRDEARSRVELFYASRGPSLGERFSKAVFDDFVQRYLGDNRPAEDVERRASQLLEALQQQVDHGAPKPKQSHLDEILRTRKEQMDRLDTEDLPEEMQDTLKSILEQQLYDRLQRVMQEDL